MAAVHDLHCCLASQSRPQICAGLGGFGARLGQQVRQNTRRVASSPAIAALQNTRPSCVTRTQKNGISLRGIYKLQHKDSRNPQYRADAAIIPLRAI
jgi:hypothetical protein